MADELPGSDYRHRRHCFESIAVEPPMRLRRLMPIFGCRWNVLNSAFKDASLRSAGSNQAAARR
jgi:hypothetical protein